MILVRGGLAAGVTLVVTGIGSAALLRDAVVALTEALGELPGWMGPAHVAMRLAAGVALTWVFVATRGRVASLPGALAATVAAVWVLAYPAVLELWVLTGALRGGELALAAALGAAELTLATLVGWITAGRP